jgi:DNA-binding SARP family transcriptional activator
LKALPAERIQGDPWLFFLQALTRRLKDGLRSIDHFKQALDRFVAAGEEGGRLLALAYLIEAHVFFGLEPAVCREWIRSGERMLAQQSLTPYYAYAKTMLWMQIGFAYVVTGLDVSKGLSASQNACLLATRIDDGPLKVVATLVSALGMALSGEFERADEALLRIGGRVDTGVFAEYDALKALVTVELALHRGDLESAGRLLKAMEADIDTYGLLFLYPAFVDACGRHQIYERQFDAAHRTCRHLMDVAIMAGSGFYTGLAHRLAALAHYHQERFEEAAASLDQAMAAMPEDGDPTLHSMRMQLLYGLVLMHRGQLDEAEKRLRAALAFFSETAALLSLAETHLALGLLYRFREEPQSARVHLGKAGGLAQKGRFDHFVIVSSADMVCAGTLATRWLEPPEREWMARWPNPDGGAGGRPAPDPSTGDGTPPSVGSRELVPDEGTLLDIQTFGAFRVMRSGEVVMDGGKGSGGRPWLLLKAILVRGSREVPKELLMDDLWPDSTAGAAQRNLKVTLHRLRKLLEPALDAGRGSLYVHLKGNLVSLDRRFFRIDMEAFLKCCKDIGRLSLAGDVAAVLELGEKAMALYQGEFLPEEPYAPWVEMKRWALKEAYTAMALKMAYLYRRQGLMEEAAGCCKACLQADPCMEKAARALMEIFAEQGRRTTALQVFAHLREALKADVGVAPEPETMALYNRVCGK